MSLRGLLRIALAAAAPLGTAATASAVPTNCDFEFSTLSGWTTTSNNGSGTSGGYTQIVTRQLCGGGPCCSGGTTNLAPPCFTSALERVRAASTGCYAAEIFSGTGCTNGQALQWYQLSTSFVAPACGMLCFYWAAVLPDGHSCNQNANVSVTILASGTPITNPACASLRSENTPTCQTGGMGVPVFQCNQTTCGGQGPQTNFGDHGWQQCCVNIAPYGGQTITIRGRAESCTATVHGAYLLLDDLCLTTCSPTITVLPTATATRTPSQTATVSGTATASGTATETATITLTYTISQTASITPTSTESGTVTETATVSPTATISPTSTVSGTTTDSGTPTATATITSTATVTATSTVTPTMTVTATETATPTFAGPCFVVLQNQVSGPESVVAYRFCMPETTTAVLSIYNSAGEQVREIREHLEGRREYIRAWDLRNYAGARVSTNVYILRFRAGSFFGPIRKVAVLR